MEVTMIVSALEDTCLGLLHVEIPGIPHIRTGCLAFIQLSRHNAFLAVGSLPM